MGIDAIVRKPFPRYSIQIKEKTDILTNQTQLLTLDNIKTFYLNKAVPNHLLKLVNKG
jgi:hypothetical protein